MTNATRHNMRDSSILRAALVLVGALAFGSANAALVDFESLPDGVFASYSEQGVTFSAIDGGDVTGSLYNNTPNGTRGIIGVDAFPFSVLQAVLSTEADFVSIDIGDAGGDEDEIFLHAYDAFGDLIGSASDFLGLDFVGMVTLSVSAPGIARVEFGGNSRNGSGSSVDADNFAVNSQVVPLPGSILLFASALVGVMSRRKFPA